jgi:protein-disulfide isomerase
MSKESKRSAREALAEERAKQAAADKRKQRLINSVIVAAVVVVVVVIFVAVQNSRTKGPADASLPQGVTQSGGPLTFGTGPVTVDLWEDFQCPNCKQFESINGKYLKQQAESNQITLAIHPVTFLNQNLQNDSSTLASNAFGCAVPSGTTEALNFHSTIYDNQPPENPGQPAWDNSQLIGWAGQNGVSGSDFEACVNDGTFDAWTQQVTASMTNDAVTGTPTIFIDGKKQTNLNWTDPKALPAAIAAAQSSSSGG